MCVFCCRRYILRGSSLRLLLLMWPVLGSWSLRSPQITGHLSSGLTVMVWIYFPHLNIYMHVCFPGAFVWIWLKCDYHVFAYPVERSEWVIALEDCIRVKHQLNSTISSSLIPHFQGYLEHRGLRSKIYTVVIADKVFLYKNMEVRGILVLLCLLVVYEIKPLLVLFGNWMNLSNTENKMFFN